jgi:hypothetical protein
MNYTYHGTRDLIALPGRSVQTFPSGLVRVDRTYACRAADAGRFREQFAVGNPLPFDDGSPSIDQLSIFPEPQEERGDDGFVRFRVSAYGRVNTTGTVQSYFESGTFIVVGSGISGSFSREFPCINEVVQYEYVVPNTQLPENNLPPISGLRVFVTGNDGSLVPISNIYPSGKFKIESGDTVRRTTTIVGIIQDSPGSVFGLWKENVYVVRAQASVSELYTFEG